MNHKPQLESYGALIFYELNLKRARVIIKHRRVVINVSQNPEKLKTLQETKESIDGMWVMN
jgi:hypothetical protein